MFKIIQKDYIRLICLTYFGLFPKEKRFKIRVRFVSSSKNKIRNNSTTRVIYEFLNWLISYYVKKYRNNYFVMTKHVFFSSSSHHIFARFVIEYNLAFAGYNLLMLFVVQMAILCNRICFEQCQFCMDGT